MLNPFWLYLEFEWLTSELYYRLARKCALYEPTCLFLSLEQDEVVIIEQSVALCSFPNGDIDESRFVVAS